MSTFNITGASILASAKAAADMDPGMKMRADMRDARVTADPIARDVNGNRKIAGHSPQGVAMHIERMGNFLAHRFEISFEHGHRAAVILHNENCFRMFNLRTTWGVQTGRIINAAVEAAR